jgi:hypothetical protein
MRNTWNKGTVHSRHQSRAKANKPRNQQKKSLVVAEAIGDVISMVVLKGILGGDPRVKVGVRQGVLPAVQCPLMTQGLSNEGRALDGSGGGDEAEQAV